MTNYGSSVWITQNYFCSHVNQFINKEQTAFKHFLMNQDSSFCLSSNTKTILNKSGVNPGQGASATVKTEPSI